MIVLEPKKINKGIYRYVARNNIADFTFLYDMASRVYHLDLDCELKNAGILHPETQLEYNKISFHPSSRNAAVILKDNSIAVSDFGGNLLWEKPGLFESLMMSNDGSFIWAIEKLDKEHLRISIINSISGSLLNSYEMDDELYDSTPRISDIPHSDHVILELAAGQDGICLCECEFINVISLKKIFPHHSYITPAWSPDGSKMFMLENDGQTYAHFSYPQYELLSEQSNIDFDDEDLCPGYNMIYLKNGIVITQNANYCHFIFDPVKMERVDEIVFRDYEPVPTNQIYKNLKDDTTLYSRITYFDRIGDLLVARTDNKDEDQTIFFINEDTIPRTK